MTAESQLSVIILSVRQGKGHEIHFFFLAVAFNFSICCEFMLLFLFFLFYSVLARI